jgi:beta-glucosidase
MSYAVDDLKATVGGENPDPVVVNALVEAMHHNLYTIINSAAMNGVGENTVVNGTTPAILRTVKMITVILGILSVPFLVMWVLGSRKLKKTGLKAELKAAKAAWKQSRKHVKS